MHKEDASVYIGGTSPYVSCTWKDAANCAKNQCDLSRVLACRWDPKEYKFAIIGNIPSAFMIVLSLIMTHIITGMLWPYIVWVSWFLIIWPLGLEAFVLCRHCPYYADSTKKKTITCWALRFMPKWWKPNPRPMNKLEKFIFQAFVWDGTQVWGVIFCGYTLAYVALHYGKYGPVTLAAMIGIFIGLLLSIYQFGVIMTMHNCSRCVAFSCPKNKVPKRIVDAYLERNPVMKEAWVKDGYRFDEVQRQKNLY